MSDVSNACVASLEILMSSSVFMVWIKQTLPTQLVWDGLISIVCAWSNSWRCTVGTGRSWACWMGGRKTRTVCHTCICLRHWSPFDTTGLPLVGYRQAAGRLPVVLKLACRTVSLSVGWCDSWSYFSDQFPAQSSDQSPRCALWI